VRHSRQGIGVAPSRIDREAPLQADRCSHKAEEDSLEKLFEAGGPEIVPGLPAA
jgi:hypothetical protein